MFILEVSYGCPSKKYPLNGIFQMDQAKALKDIDNKVVFVAIDVRSIRKWRHWGLIEKEEFGIPVIEFNVPFGPVFPKLRTKISKLMFKRALGLVINKYGKPDIIHVHFGDTAKCVVDTCKKENIPYVVTEHSSGINRDDLTEEEIESFRDVYNNARAVIAVSSVLAKRIEHYFGVQPVVIPNIIDLKEFKIAKIKHNNFQFISAGNLNNIKGFDVLIKAFANLIDIGINAKLLIMGDGPERKNLENLVTNYNISDKVEFFGTYIRSQFAEKLSESDCFVLASRGETFGVVYAEALTSGTPVIATRCGGPEDFVNESNGILVDIGDVDKLTTAMMIIKDNIDVFDIKAISRNANKMFSSLKIATDICNTIKGRLYNV